MNDFKKEYLFHKKAVDAAISDVLESGWYILGTKGEEFERAFAQYAGTKYCIGVANGLEALQIALTALGIGGGDEVITVSNSAVATALAITNAGATPVFVDIDEYYHMNPAALEAAISPRTKAILPVHLFGQLANMGEIGRIAAAHNIPVVEDACQAYGAAGADGRRAGSYGTLGCFSFYPTKNLGTYGDGGAITTNSKELYEACRKLRNYGQSTRYYHDVKGINSRLDELHAAVLTAKMKTSPQLIERRRAIAARYDAGLRALRDVSIPAVRSGTNHAYHLYVIRAPRRDDLIVYLKEKGIEAQIHYPVPIHKQQCYEEFNSITLPATEQAAREIVSLPIHPFMTDAEADAVIYAVTEFYTHKS